MSQDTELLNVFLRDITIDASVKSIDQLIKKYNDKAKNVDWAQVLAPNHKGNLCFSMRIEFPLLGLNIKDNYLHLSHVSSALKKINDEILALFYNAEYGSSIKKRLEAKFESGTLLGGSSRPDFDWGKINNTEESRQLCTKLQWPVNNVDTSEKKKLEDYWNDLANMLPEDIYNNKDRKLTFLYYSIDVNPNDTEKMLTCFWGFSDIESEIAESNIDQLSVNKEIKENIQQISSAIRNKHTSNLQELLKRETVKSAKAAIMSRNMSHNIGSHVMSYLKQKLGSITAIMSSSSEVLYNLFDGAKLNSSLLEAGGDFCALLQKSLSKKNSNTPDDDKVNVGIQLPFLVGTGRFIGYLQERQDYIATIATDYIPYGAPVNLKDAIYDELNPDLRHMRHKTDDNNRPMNILLNYIAKSEGLSRENMNNCNTENEMDDKFFRRPDEERFKTKNDILFGYPKYDNDKSEPHVFGLRPDCNKSNDPALSEMRKVNFSLPGGLVGRQAIFSIIENLIRNATKHGNPRSTKPNNEGNLELTFDVIDIRDLDNVPQIEQRICDERWRKLYKKATDKEKLFLFSITDNLYYPDNDKLFKNLENALVEDYLDDHGNLANTNKGIKEIRISAAWIRSEMDEDLYLRLSDNGNSLPEKKAPLVAIERTNEGHLRYMICIPQDRLVAVVTEGMNAKDVELFQKMHNQSAKDWELYDNVANLKADHNISYHYILVANDEIYNNLRPVISNRLFVWPKDGHSKYMAELAKAEKTDDEDLRYSIQKNSILKIVYGIDDNSETIYIWDGTTVRNHEKDTNLSKKIILASSDAKGASVAKYVYRTHHSNENDFKTYWEKKKQPNGPYNAIECIDAITGDNSSDRIVRREPLGDDWYYSHLYALKKKVAIFDERLFKTVHNIDENKFIVNNDLDYTKLDGFIEQIKKGDKDFKTLRKEISDSNLFQGLAAAGLYKPRDINKLKDYLEGFKKTFIPQESDNYKSIVYEEKGVDVFTIVKEKNNTFAIIGYVGSTMKDGEIITRYDKVATISSTNNPFSINIEFNKLSSYDNEVFDFSNKYDYISIHQGILDKIYEGFGIKDCGTKKDRERNNPRKCEVTRCLHDKFMKKEYYNPIPINDKNGNKIEDFLPCFIIHSGRAKPTKDDMPQKLPFIQYAAIEHGVLDCKYSIIELLDYARYEE